MKDFIMKVRFTCFHCFVVNRFCFREGNRICGHTIWQRELTEEEEMTLRQTLGLPGNDSR